MAMNLSGNEAPELNTTPLIDVMLVLLTLLIITLPIQTHAVKLDLQRGDVALPVPVVVVDVQFDGAMIWDGRRVDRATLDANLADAAKQDPQPEIHVSADKLTRYDAVAKVLADAQRLGVTHIGVEGTGEGAR